MPLPRFRRRVDARNLLLNGAFQIAQHGTTFDSTTTPANNNGAYLLDQWVLHGEANDDADVSQDTTTVPAGALNSLKLDTETSNDKYGILQFIEAQDTARAVNGGTGKVSLSFEAYLPAASTNISTLRVGILQWAGTADSPDITPVSVWNAAGADPTLVANCSFANTPSDLTLVDDTWTTFTVPGITLSSSTTNLGIFIWVDDTDAVAGSDIFYVGNVQLVIGDRVDTYGHRPYAEELALCQRYLQVIKADTIGDVFASGMSTTTAAGRAAMTLPVTMHAAPTLVVGSAASDFRWFHQAATEALTTLALTQATKTTVGLSAGVAATPLTAGDGAILEAVNTNAKLTFVAQL